MLGFQASKQSRVKEKNKTKQKGVNKRAKK